MAPPRSTPPHQNRWLVAGLMLVFVALCVAYNMALPLFEAPDEGAHYIYVDYIARNRSLPSMVDLQSLEVSQPPLYYVLSAPLIAWIDRSDFAEVYRQNPGLENGIVNDHLPKERIVPPTGVTLAVRVLRLYTTLLGALTVLLIYATTRVLFRRDDVALLALAVTAFNPKFLHMSSQFNNDMAVAVTAALCVWLAARAMVQETPPPARQWLALGGAVGLATASKYSGMVLAVPVAFAVVWCVARHRQHAIRSLVTSGALCLGGFALTGGWLLAYNTLRYGHPLALTQFQSAHAAGIRPVGLSAMEIVERMPKVLTSYWGEIGHGVQAPLVVDQIMLVVVAIIVAGVILALARRALPAESSILVVTALVTFGAFLVWLRNQTGTENARLLSPAFGAVSIFAAAGLLEWVPHHWGRAASQAGAALAVAGGTAGLFIVMLPSYATPVYLDGAQTAALPAQGAALFDNGIELVGASLQTNRLAPVQDLGISVYWRATRPITDVYRAVVEVRDEQDNVLGRTSTLPLGGRYATTQLESGRIFRDDYHVPVSGTRRSVARVFAGWYQHRPPNAVSRVQAGGAANVQVGVVKVRGAQPAQEQPPVPFTSTLGGIAGLEGYAVDDDVLVLYWRALAAPDQDYKVFVHALDANGAIFAQADGFVAYPVSLWDAGEQIVDIRRIEGVGAAAAIRIGLYDPASGARLPAQRGQGAPWPDDAIVLPVARR